MAAKVLVKGEAVRAPAGRADDFAWPRRDVAPTGSDPVVATTDLPMTPMQEKPSAVAAAPGTPGAEGTKTAAAAEQARPVVVRRQRSYADSYYRPDQRGYGGYGGGWGGWGGGGGGWGGGLFGGGRW